MSESEITIREKVGHDIFDKIVQSDPTLEILASAPWQSTFSAAVYTSDPSIEDVTADGDSKPPKDDWATLQSHCWSKYRNFGPINATVNAKSDYTAGSGFDVYSDDLDISRFLFDLWYSRRNRLYSRAPGLMTRMQAEGELFLLLVFDEEGRVTIRVVEPGRIKGDTGDATDKSAGLISNPDDATETLFYIYKENELIPDINIAFDPDLLKVAKTIPVFDVKKTAPSLGKGGKYKKIGGYRRFILHWKNLTGIHEYKRDTSSLYAILEALNMYWNAIKWQLDHKKAQAAYALEFDFEDSGTGKLAWLLYKKMTPAEKKAAGFSGALTPGSRIMTPPGVKLSIKNPQLQKMDGENRDLLNLAGAGASSPTDMFQGDSRNTSHAAIQSTRAPLELDIENMQYKFSCFVKYELLRSCFYVASQFGLLPEVFKKPMVRRKPGKKGYDASIEFIDAEPIELIGINTPVVRFEGDPHEKASAFLGNNHEGLKTIGLSNERIARSMGIRDLTLERDKKFIEDQKYGVAAAPAKVDDGAAPL